MLYFVTIYYMYSFNNKCSQLSNDSRNSSSTLCQCEYCRCVEEMFGIINNKRSNKNNEKKAPFDHHLKSNKNTIKQKSKSMNDIPFIKDTNDNNDNESKKDDFISNLHSSQLNMFYERWQSEKFKVIALEKDNEKLSSHLKYLQDKLDKEILQQIKISLEWRKTVVSLVDENKKLMDRNKLLNKQQQ
jgi:hypothetical protein